MRSGVELHGVPVLGHRHDVTVRWLASVRQRRAAAAAQLWWRGRSARIPWGMPPAAWMLVGLLLLALVSGGVAHLIGGTSAATTVVSVLVAVVFALGAGRLLYQVATTLHASPQQQRLQAAMVGTDVTRLRDELGAHVDAYPDDRYLVNGLAVATGHDALWRGEEGLRQHCWVDWQVVAGTPNTVTVQITPS